MLRGLIKNGILRRRGSNLIYTDDSSNCECCASCLCTSGEFEGHVANRQYYLSVNTSDAFEAQWDSSSYKEEYFNGSPLNPCAGITKQCTIISQGTQSYHFRLAGLSALNGTYGPALPYIPTSFNPTPSFNIPCDGSFEVYEEQMCIERPLSFAGISVPINGFITYSSSSSGSSDCDPSNPYLNYSNSFSYNYNLVGRAMVFANIGFPNATYLNPEILTVFRLEGNGPFNGVVTSMTISFLNQKFSKPVFGGLGLPINCTCNPWFYDGCLGGIDFLPYLFDARTSPIPGLGISPPSNQELCETAYIIATEYNGVGPAYNGLIDRYRCEPFSTVSDSKIVDVCTASYFRDRQDPICDGTSYRILRDEINAIRHPFELNMSVFE